MSRPRFIPNNDAEFDIWLKNLIAKLSLHSAQLGITSAEIAALQADSAMLTFVLAQITIQQRELDKRFEFKRNFLDGNIGAIIGAFPASAAVAAAPAAVTAGLVKRIANLVKRIKGMTSYTVVIGKDLGIIPSKQVRSLRADEKPSFVLGSSAGHPMVKVKKNGIEAFNIYVDRNDGRGFVLLCGCTRTKYIDMYPLPAVTTNWTYKIVYTKGMVEYGVPSDASTIAVINVFPTDNKL